MNRLNPVNALFSLGVISSTSRCPSASNASPSQASKPQPKHIEGYIDGYTYRKLASPTQVTVVIRDFFREFVGQDGGTHEVMGYVQQWHEGRSLRSIRDEIARCPQAQRWG